MLDKEHIVYLLYGGQILCHRSDTPATPIYSYKNHAIYII